MPRWEPDARARLVSAALDLYAHHGYETTTVGDIAARAGVTSRTYFRYFPDKREVLFGGAERLRTRIETALGAASADLAALPTALTSISACADLFEVQEHDALRRRDAVIAVSEELQEREARKLGLFATVIADGLVARGSDRIDAELVADLAVVVFKQASRLWMADPATPFGVFVDRAAAQLRDQTRVR